MGNKNGFTLIEFLIVSAIVAVVAMVISSFQNNLFSLNTFLEESLSIQRDAEAVMKSVVAELRTASQSNTGGYPIEKAEPFSLAFYANIDADPARERIQYFLDDSLLKRSVVKPAGSPLTYSTTTATEMLSVVLRNLVASSTAPLFSYYDRNYAGTTTPLAVPVNVLAVRLVAIQLTADERPNDLVPEITVKSQVTIRNLKDN